MILGAAAKQPADQERFAVIYTPLIRAYLAARWRLPLEHEEVGDATQEVLLQCFRDHGALETLDPGGRTVSARSSTASCGTSPR